MKRILLLTIFIFIFSCNNNDKSSLKINIVNEVSSLDPRKVRDLNSISVMKMLYEGLTRIEKNNDIGLGVAKKIDISKDKKTYVFHLKKSFWNNGDEVTSYDFEYSIKKSLSPSFPSTMSYKLFIIENAKKAKEGKISIDDIGVKTKGPNILIIKLKQPAPYFLELLSHPCFFPVSKKLDKENINWPDNENTHVGNGPFFIKKWKRQNKIDLIKNKRYWDQKNVKLNGITLYMISEQTELKMYETGQLNWAGSPFSSLPIDSLKKLSKQEYFYKKPFLGTSFLRVNMDWIEKVLSKEDSLSFQKALAKNIDRKAITNHILHNTRHPASFLLPPKMNISCNIKDSNICKKDYSKKLSLPIKLMYTIGSHNHLVAQAIQRTWENALNIKVQLVPLEHKVYFNKLYSGKYEIAMGSWIADVNDPINFLEVFKFKNNGTNNTNWENPNYKNFLDLAEKETDLFKRNLFLEKAQEILMKENPIIPIYHFNMLYLKNKNVKDVFISKVGHADFKWAYIED